MLMHIGIVCQLCLSALSPLPVCTICLCDSIQGAYVDKPIDAVDRLLSFRSIGKIQQRKKFCVCYTTGFVQECNIIEASSTFPVMYQSQMLNPCFHPSNQSFCCGHPQHFGHSTLNLLGILDLQNTNVLSAYRKTRYVCFCGQPWV